MSLQRYLFRFIDLLRDEVTPNHIALGALFGLWVGLTPIMTLHGVLLFVGLLLIRANLIMFFFSALFFAGLGSFLDTTAHHIGHYILAETPQLRRLWAGIYHAPIITFLRLTNTVVMGYFVISAICSVPLFFATRFLWKRYEEKFLVFLFETRFFIQLSSSYFMRYYAHYRRTKDT